ncbi:hypothetical protein AB0L13_09370 [Saccharopolyspora shandongensis]|uniref:hypothetical protein n=1 Tax=Saccharopolyspora shandongensis TaxID=418495 RepID=UPI003414CF96
MSTLRWTAATSPSSAAQDEMMLWLLCGGEYDVTTLAAAVGVARPAVSSTSRNFAWQV